jgi:hypothetical protein
MNLTPSDRYDFAIFDSLYELWEETPHKFHLAGKDSEFGRRVRRKMRAILTHDDLHGRYPSSGTDPIWINRCRTRLGEFKKNRRVETLGHKQGWRLSSLDWIRRRRERFALEQYASLLRLAKSVNDRLRCGELAAATAMSIDQIVRFCGWDLEPNSFRDSNVWSAFQQGAPGFTAFRDGGLVISFAPDATGREVEQITMRVDRVSESADIRKSA